MSRSKVGLSFVLLVLALESPFAWSLTFTHVRVLEVKFLSGGSALDAGERERLAKFAQEVLSLGCVMSVASFGYTDRSEGTEPVRAVLSDERAKYVAGALMRYGIQKAVPVEVSRAADNHPNCAKSLNSCALVEVSLMRKGAPTCP